VNARVVVGAVVALVAAGAIAAAIAFGLASDSQEPAPRQLEAGEPIAVATTLSPQVHRIGDLVVATVELTVDQQLIDPDRIDVRAQFSPYELAGEVSVTRATAGDLAIMRFTYGLQCLSSDCAGEESPRLVELPAALVSYLRRDTNRGVDLPVPWPTSVLVSRAGDGAGSVPAEAILGGFPEQTYIVSPSLLRGLAIGLAVLLVLAAAIWAWHAVRPARRARDAASHPPESPHTLERALEQLAQARHGSQASQRLALEALAVELGSASGAKLAPRARRLAWSQGGIEAAELDAVLTEAQELEQRS
jgi:hypothetical protein